MALLKVVAKALRFIKHLAVKTELDTINWVEELRLIACACLLAAIIVISICALSSKLSRYSPWTSAVTKFTSYFYHPPRRLRRSPIGGRRRRPLNQYANLDEPGTLGGEYSIDLRDYLWAGLPKEDSTVSAPTKDKPRAHYDVQ
ncbi:hypothetical protein GGR53DRAFT_331135 [Hypoxylon sp. FL1150]|nr:hypothetical protein GGR53DRAFT_331135 [Hypoxylon sp. FL1150]